MSCSGSNSQFTLDLNSKTALLIKGPPFRLLCCGYLKECNSQPAHDKTYNKTCVTGKDSDQPVHPPSMARVLIYPTLESPETTDGTCNQRSLISLRWSHCRFCHKLAQSVIFSLFIFYFFFFFFFQLIYFCSGELESRFEISLSRIFPIIISKERYDDSKISTLDIYPNQ